MGSKNSDAVKRAKLRKRLIAWGMDDKEIGLCLEQVKRNQKAKKAGTLPLDAPLCTRAEYVRLVKENNPPGYQGAAVLNLGAEYESPSDKGFKPTKINPLLVGAGRVTGQAAKAVRRGTTMRKYEYDNHT